MNDNQAGTQNKSDAHPWAGDSIILLGIFCCAIAIVIVLAVALVAS